MKIVYSAGNRSGAASQLERFLQAIGPQHQVKIAAYTKSSFHLPTVDWILDALFHPLTPKVSSKYFLSKFLPCVNQEVFELLCQDLEDFNPDLVICDGELVVASLAKVFDFPLWYCSPLHLLDGSLKEKGELRYQAHLVKWRKFLSYLPPASQYLIYSPWGSMPKAIPLKSQYNWIQPYFVPRTAGISSCEFNLANCPEPTRFPQLARLLGAVSQDIILLDNFQLICANQESYADYLSSCRWLFTTAETSSISDALYNGISNLCLAPTLDDPESILNVAMCQRYGIGSDVGQVELMGPLAVEEVANTLVKQSPSTLTLQPGMFPTLDQKIKICM